MTTFSASNKTKEAIKPKSNTQKEKFPTNPDAQESASSSSSSSAAAGDSSRQALCEQC
jgi:hypothetical protein